MKKFKKLIALTCVAAMVVSPMTAYADVTTETTSENKTIIENDNSKAPVYTAVELPTINDGTYDFSIDRDKLLAKYDYEGSYDPASHVYFNVVKDPATLEHGTVTDGTTYTLNKKVFNVDTKQADDDVTEATPTFITTLTTNAELVSDDALAAAKTYIGTAANQVYYVWQPVEYAEGDEKAAEARGQYVKIDDTNIANIIEIEVGGTTEAPTYTYVLKNDHDSGEFIWDGNIYKEAFVALSATEAVGYVKAEKAAVGDTYTITVPDPATAAPEDVLYLGTKVGEADATYAAVTDGTTLKYTPATFQYKDISDAATVENKSTTPIAVKVEINVTDDTGINYVDADNVSDTEKASIYLAIKSGDNVAAVKDSNATAYYVLDGATNKTMVYQVTDEKVNATGSHEYAQFELPNPVYNKATFTIEADVNEAEAADAAWKTYIDSLTATDATVTKPTIDVVYSWEKVEEAKDAEGNVVEGQYVNTAEKHSLRKLQKAKELLPMKVGLQKLS